MNERTEVMGTVVVVYDSISEFVAALEKSGAKRLFTFANAGLFGIGANWTATFIDKDRVVCGYVDSDLGERFQGRIHPIYDLIEKFGIPEVDGTIKVSARSGTAHQIFQSDAPGEEESVQASYDSWRDAVLALSEEGTVIQYVKDGSGCIIDAVKDNVHLVTVLEAEGARSFDNALVWMKGYRLQDNGPVIDWFKDMENE